MADSSCTAQVGWFCANSRKGNAGAWSNVDHYLKRLALYGAIQHTVRDHSFRAYLTHAEAYCWDIADSAAADPAAADTVTNAAFCGAHILLELQQGLSGYMADLTYSGNFDWDFGYLQQPISCSFLSCWGRLDNIHGLSGTCWEVLLECRTLAAVHTLQLPVVLRKDC